MSVSEMESYRDLILENIEYDHQCREFTTYREDLDEIVELMVETVCAKRKTTRIAGSDFPHEVVRSRFWSWIAPTSSLSWNACGTIPPKSAT